MPMAMLFFGYFHSYIRTSLLEAWVVQNSVTKHNSSVYHLFPLTIKKCANQTMADLPVEACLPPHHGISKIPVVSQEARIERWIFPILLSGQRIIFGQGRDLVGPALNNVMRVDNLGTGCFLSLPLAILELSAGSPPPSLLILLVRRKQSDDLCSD